MWRRESDSATSATERGQIIDGTTKRHRCDPGGERSQEPLGASGVGGTNLADSRGLRIDLGEPSSVYPEHQLELLKHRRAGHEERGREGIRESLVGAVADNLPNGINAGLRGTGFRKVDQHVGILVGKVKVSPIGRFFRV